MEGEGGGRERRRSRRTESGRYSRSARGHSEQDVTEVVYLSDSPGGGYAANNPYGGEAERSFGELSPSAAPWQYEEGNTPFDRYKMPPVDMYGGGHRHHPGSYPNQPIYTPSQEYHASVTDHDEYTPTPRPGSLARHLKRASSRGSQDSHQSQYEQMVQCTEAMSRMGMQGGSGPECYSAGAGGTERYDLPPGESDWSTSRRRRGKGKAVMQGDYPQAEHESEEKQMRRAMHQSLAAQQQYLQEQQQQQQHYQVGQSTAQPWLTFNKATMQMESSHGPVLVTQSSTGSIKVEELMKKVWAQVEADGPMPAEKLAERIRKLCLMQRAREDEIVSWAEARVYQTMSKEYFEAFRRHAWHYGNAIKALRQHFVAQNMFDTSRAMEEEIYKRFVSFAKKMVPKQQLAGQQQGSGSVAGQGGAEEVLTDAELIHRATQTFNHFMLERIGQIIAPEQLSTARIEQASRRLQWEEHSTSETERYLLIYLLNVLNRSEGDIQTFRDLRQQARDKARAAREKRNQG